MLLLHIGIYEVDLHLNYRIGLMADDYVPKSRQVEDPQLASGTVFLKNLNTVLVVAVMRVFDIATEKIHACIDVFHVHRLVDRVDVTRGNR